jgi:hypothetical protein
MKTLALIALATLTLSTSAFASDRPMESAPAPIDGVESPVPDVRWLPVGLRRAVLWAYFLTQNPNPSVLDLAAGVRFVQSMMMLRGEGA